MSHSSRLESLKAADFAYFGATWWPRARYERLRIVTFLAIWVGGFHIAVNKDLAKTDFIPQLFVWDDGRASCSLNETRSLR